MTARPTSVAPEDPVRAFHIIWRGAHKARAGETAMEHRLVACLHAGDPILETAYYLTVGRRGETRVFLVQGRSVEQTSSVAIIRGRSTTMTSGERDERPGQDPAGPPSAVIRECQSGVSE